MKTTETIETRTCDRCGGGKCVQVAQDVLALWHAAQVPEQPVTTPDLCRRCIERIIALAAQIRTQRRRQWSEAAE